MPVIKTLKNGTWQPVSSIVDLPVATQSTNGLMASADKAKLDKMSNYSTSEQVVGTWIDGKPIYRKVITGLNATLTSGSWTNLVDVSSLDIEALVSCRLYRGGVGTLAFYQIITPFEVEMSSGYIRAWDTYTDGSISKCIVEYTKTTD